MDSILNTKSTYDREYFITIKTEYKILEKKYLTKQEELKKWENRAKLAKENSKIKLLSEAENQVENIQDSIKHLVSKLIELKSEAGNALESTNKLPEQLSNNPAKLLKDMEKLIGDSKNIELENEIIDIEVDNDLKKLKEKIKS